MRTSKPYMSETAPPLCWSMACIISCLLAAHFLGLNLKHTAYWCSIAAAPGLFAVLFDRLKYYMICEIILWGLCAGWIMAASEGGLAGSGMMLAIAIIRPCTNKREDMALPAACYAVVIALLSQYAALSGLLPQDPTAHALNPLLGINAVGMLALYALQMADTHRSRMADEQEKILQAQIHEEQKHDLTHRAMDMQDSARRFQYERDIAQQELSDQKNSLSDSENRLLFLTGTTRNIRSSLDSIIGFADELYKAPLSPIGKHYNSYARHIKESGQFLQITLDGMTCLYKTDAHLLPDFVSLKDVASHAFALIEPEARKRGVQLSQIRSGDVEVYADPAALRQIVLNMICAALERTPKGGQAALWSRQLPDSGALLGIQDSGTGLKSKDLLETSLFTTPENGKISKGLGLTVSRVLIEAHGGSLQAESDPYKGNSVWVQFPGAPQQTPSHTRETALLQHRKPTAKTPATV